MNDSPGHDCGLTPQLRAEGKKLVARTEFSVFTRAECESAWKIYSDWEQWRKFSDIYGETIEWLGVPWEPGSRLRVEFVKPFPLRHESEIVVYIPPRCVAWVARAKEYRLEQWVLFYPYNGGGTRISAWAELFGRPSFAESMDLRQALQDILVNWFAGFCRHCNRIVDGLNP